MSTPRCWVDEVDPLQTRPTSIDFPAEFYDDYSGQTQTRLNVLAS